jgi:glycerol-3-phosphate acyltransferase PlsY
MMAVVTWLGAVVLAYLVGSIPTAYLLVRAVKGVDIRTLGSGNVGATNAGRLLGAWAFVLVFVIDLLKGSLTTFLIPSMAARLGAPHANALAVCVAVATIVGHNFPIYLGFRGGKGVATSLGVVIALDPIAALAATVAFVLIALVTRIVSLSSILAALCFVVAHFSRIDAPWRGSEAVMSGATLALAVLLIVRHRANLVRIARGTEPRFGRQRRSTENSPNT